MLKKETLPIDRNWQLPNNTFWPKSNMGNSTYRKLFISELFGNCHTLYLHYRFERGFEVMKKIRILKTEGDWDKLKSKIYLCRQSWRKYLEQTKGIKQNWPGAENCDNCFSVIFNCYYKSFISGRRTWH